MKQILNKYNKITKLLFFVFSLILLIFALVIAANSTARTKVSCNVEGIHLVDVSPANCYVGEISAKFCPIPTNIKCDLDIPMPLLSRMSKEVN